MDDENLSKWFGLEKTPWTLSPPPGESKRWMNFLFYVTTRISQATCRQVSEVVSEINFASEAEISPGMKILFEGATAFKVIKQKYLRENDSASDTSPFKKIRT